MLGLMTAFTSCSIEAHAKVNIVLDVLGTRPDGFHDLRSIVMPVELHDDLEIEVGGPGGGVAVEVVPDGVDVSHIGPAEDNLCVKAVKAYFAAIPPCGTHRAPEMRIHIVKRIPLGGGMGGGSADAAATLVALDWFAARGVFAGEVGPVGEKGLLEIAAEVGSDVPALLLGGAVLMEGRGEKVSRLRGVFPPVDLLLANPGVHVSTPAAFRALDAGRSSGSCPRNVPPVVARLLTNPSDFGNILSSRNCGEALSGFTEMLYNGLEGAVFELHPEVALIAAKLREAGSKGVLMSGSGATVFALASSPEEAGILAESLPRGCRAVISRTVPDGVMAAHGPLEA